MLNLTICAHVNSNRNPHIKITNFVRVLYQNTMKKRLYIAIVNLRIEYQQSICASLTTGVS